jgi:hypothetical protein
LLTDSNHVHPMLQVSAFWSGWLAFFRLLIPAEAAPASCASYAYMPSSIAMMDTVPPVANCVDGLSVQLDTSGRRSLSALAFDQNSYDLQSPNLWFKVRRLLSGPCGSDSLLRSSITFCCEEAGDSVAVLLRVYDVAIPDTLAVNVFYQQAHASDCTTKVAVRDFIKPRFIAPANVTLGCQAFAAGQVPTPTATDNCGIDTITYLDQFLSFDVNCTRGQLRRRFTAHDASGNTATTSMLIQVNHLQNYAVRFPTDTIISACTGGNIVAGTPQVLHATCEKIVIGFSDVRQPNTSGVPNACQVIRRTWRIYNECTYNPSSPYVLIPNPNPAANPADPANFAAVIVADSGSTPAPTLVKLTPTAAAPTDFSDYWSTTSNGYEYTQLIYLRDTQEPLITGTSIPFVCDISANNPLLWSGPEWYEEVTMLNDLRESPIMPTLSVTDACAGNQISGAFELLLDLDNNDTLDTRIMSGGSPVPGTINFYNILIPPNGTPQAFDKRTIGINQKYIFALQREVMGDTVRFRAGWNTLANPSVFVPLQLPYGRHRINWTVTDPCSNILTRSYPIVISNDCNPPEMVCNPDLEVYLPATGGDSVRISPEQLVASASDDYTTTDNLVFGISEPPYPDLLPETPQGEPITSLEFDCAHLGFRPIRIWVRDLGGNLTTCDATVILRDTSLVCMDPPSAIRGQVRTTLYGAIPDALVRITQLPASTAMDTIECSESGQFIFNDLTPYENYVLEAYRDSTDIKNGVSTFDLLLISRHILGLEPFDTPYKMIAADVNRSNTITTFDIVTARKAILGVITEFPGNTSWRFVPQSFTFPNPQNPFMTPFGSSMTLANLVDVRDSVNFWAIKVGDVNLSAIPEFLQEAGDDRDVLPVGLELFFDVEMSHTQSPALIPLYASAKEPLYGFQLELAWPNNALITNEFRPVALQQEQFVIRPESGTMRVSYDAQLHPKDGRILLGYIPKAWGTDLVQIVSAKNFNAEAYTPTGQPLRIEWDASMKNTTTLSPSNTAQWLPNQPNPFAEATVLHFWVPEAGEVNIRITDLQGKVIYQQMQTYTSGHQQFRWEATALPSGIYTCWLETADGLRPLKIVKR